MYKLKQINSEEGDNVRRSLDMNKKIIHPSEDGNVKNIEVNQKEYIESFVNKYNIETNKLIKTFLIANYYFVEDQYIFINKVDKAKLVIEHKQQIGSLVCLCIMT
jgi:hypothetical protein